MVQSTSSKRRRGARRSVRWCARFGSSTAQLFEPVRGGPSQGASRRRAVSASIIREISRSPSLSCESSRSSRSSRSRQAATLRRASAPKLRTSSGSSRSMRASAASISWSRARQARWASSMPALSHSIPGPTSAGPEGSEGGCFALPFRLVLGLQLLHPAPDQLALERAQVVDEELALQVVHLVLDADGEQRVGRFLPLPLAVAVGVLHHDVPEPGDLLVLVGDGETALGIGELALAELQHRVDQPEEPFALLLRFLAFGGGALV